MATLYEILIIVTLQLLQRTDGKWLPKVVIEDDLKHLDAFDRVRCPLCTWAPTPSSRWSCDHRDTPEPPFASCGTVWQTFETRGRCPGCAHQWQWTTCISCGQASPHDEWYERDGNPGPSFP